MRMFPLPSLFHYHLFTSLLRVDGTTFYTVAPSPKSSPSSSPTSSSAPTIPALPLATTTNNTRPLSYPTRSKRPNQQAQDACYNNYINHHVTNVIQYQKVNEFYVYTDPGNCFFLVYLLFILYYFIIISSPYCFVEYNPVQNTRTLTAR
jgi:hypothetical protein